MKDELDEANAKLIRAELLVGSLREAIINTVCFDCDSGPLSGKPHCNDNACKVYMILASTRPYLEKQLEKAERVLKFVNEYEWFGIKKGKEISRISSYYTGHADAVAHKLIIYCRSCNNSETEGHTKTCELAAFKRDWDAIKKELE